ncbi:nematocyst expressed protein 3-like [Dicentrarchus labrax]|uniref:nematocyst expressed protein 3-like n=1 Tax=Dicentrarchus labrax TaxID=13489 RepID=UPI0021F5148E|nr:nematocyst expressed protein 3-like [Dicentrarchus labrax]
MRPRPGGESPSARYVSPAGVFLEWILCYTGEPPLPQWVRSPHPDVIWARAPGDGRCRLILTPGQTLHERRLTAVLGSHGIHRPLGAAPVGGSRRHTKRSKAMMRDTIAIAVPGPSASQTAAEPLPAPRTVLQQPEQPDQPLQHRLPADASGLAATIRGPLAPELYDLIVASSSTATTSSSSSATPQASTSVSADAVRPPVPAQTPSRPPAQRQVSPPPQPQLPLLHQCLETLPGGASSRRRKSVVPGSWENI